MVGCLGKTGRNETKRRRGVAGVGRGIRSGMEVAGRRGAAKCANTFRVK